MNPRNKYYPRVIGREIIKQYRLNATNASLSLGNDVTFNEFVKYLIDPKTTEGKPFDPHWLPQHQHCHPCAVDNDFIGKYETLEEDANFVMSRLGLGPTVKFRGPVTSTAGPAKTSDLLQQYFSKVPVSDIRRLWEFFHQDYELFGYKDPDLLTNIPKP